MDVDADGWVDGRWQMTDGSIGYSILYFFFSLHA